MSSAFRIDSFDIPPAAMPEFQAAAQRSVEVLSTQPGFVGSRVFEKIGGDGRFNIVTIAEWTDLASIAAAGPVLRDAHLAAGFDAERFIRTHGIDESRAVYTEPATAMA